MSQLYAETLLHTLLQQSHLQVFQIMLENQFMPKPYYVVANNIEQAIISVNRHTTQKGNLLKVAYGNYNPLFNHLVSNAVTNNVQLATLQQGFIFQ